MTLQLSNNSIHVWRADLQQADPSRLAAYLAHLNANELQRNQRYSRDISRLHDSVTRMMAREVLSKYAELNPDQWCFERGEHGKPEISNAGIKLRFNLSHSSRFVVCAVTRQYDLGIDIEHIERGNKVLAIADRYFSAQEVSDLFALPSERQRDRFFDYWTLKEAYMKARGEGIALGLGNFSFRFVGEGGIAINFGDKLNDQPRHWHFCLLSPTADHRLALAFKAGADAPKPCVQYFDFPL